MNFRERFKLLAVFHYVLAAMMALCGCFPLLYVVLGLMMFSGAMNSGRPNDPPPELGLLFAGFGAVVSVFTWALAAAVAACGYYLHVQRHYLFCMIVAAIETLNMPFGTALGVFTIVTLADTQGKAMFERSNGPGPEKAALTP
ncbi:MAG: hypothetical protein WBC44_18345 [Planctomycetaceae bacterium]